MKAQKLGLVLGMNMAVACLVMQGCKAVKPEREPLPPETTETVDITTEPAPVPSVPGAGVQPQETPPPPVQTRSVGKLPPPPPPAAPVADVKKPQAPAAGSSSIHVVQRGEFLSSISKKYNVKMSAIVAANPGLNPDRIRIGQKLKIPGAPAADGASRPANVMLASAPAPAAANTTAPVKVKPAFKSYTGPTKEYVVKGGDSLGKIAYENGITIRALKELNGLKKDNVRVGQKLKIPAEKQTVAKDAKDAKGKDVKGKDAKVEKDTKAAKEAPEAKDAKKDVKKEETKEAAAAAPAAPAAEAPAAAPAAPAAPAAEAPAAAPAPEPAANTYTVKEGDDLVSISIAWGISPSQLLNANDIKEGEPLKPGQVLKLPPNAKQTVQ